MADNHRARKRFGQNFLTDESVVQQIARAINPAPTDHLIEIGPGKGALTNALAGANCQMDLIELDRDLLPILRASFTTRPRLTVHNADALRFDYKGLLGESGAEGNGAEAGSGKLRIVGNLPYNISTPLIFHLLSFAELIEDMHFMLQLEVVKRLAATPGNKRWGKLGAMAQYHCQVDSLFEVPPSAFRPAPKVQSAMVRLVPHRNFNRDPVRERRLRTVVQAAFSQRRKTLRNALRNLISVQQLEELDISPTGRAETLTLQQFLDLGELLD